MGFDRRTAAQRGYGHAWRRESRLFLAENPWCVRLGDGCTVAAMVVDHKIPHKGNMGLFWDRRNWQSLCKHCHDEHKQRMEAAAAGGERDHKGRLIR